MTDSEHRPVEDLTADLRKLAKSGGTPLAIEPARAGALADALSRFLQSSKRLRSQNAKLRRRIERLKAGLPDDVVDDAAE